MKKSWQYDVRKKRYSYLFRRNFQDYFGAIYCECECEYECECELGFVNLLFCPKFIVISFCKHMVYVV